MRKFVGISSRNSEIEQLAADGRRRRTPYEVARDTTRKEAKKTVKRICIKCLKAEQAVDKLCSSCAQVSYECG